MEVESQLHRISCVTLGKWLTSRSFVPPLGDGTGRVPTVQCRKEENEMPCSSAHTGNRWGREGGSEAIGHGGDCGELEIT